MSSTGIAFAWDVPHGVMELLDSDMLVRVLLWLDQVYRGNVYGDEGLMVCVGVKQFAKEALLGMFMPKPV